MWKEILMNEGVLSILLVLIFFGIAFFVQWLKYKIKDRRESKRFWKEFNDKMAKRDKEINEKFWKAIEESLPLIKSKLKEWANDGRFDNARYG